jgi:Family of unknown function (DUF6344)
VATARIARMWTVFVFAFLKFLSVLGITRSTARRQPTTQWQRVTSPSAPFIPAAVQQLCCEPPYELSYELPYEGFLPPTIKQRIRAEAHGATPASRRICRGSAEPSQADPIGAAATATIPAVPHRARPLCLA